MTQKQLNSSTIHKQQADDKTPFVPALDMTVFWRTTIITFVLGFIGFLILFFYIATH